MSPPSSSPLLPGTDVLVVGAGPTGLALACGLRQAGVDCVVVDRLAQGLNTSRAAVIHAHTLDVLGGIGVTDRLLAAGLPLARFTIRDRDEALLRLRFDTLPGRQRQLLMLPQDATEAILAQRLAELGGSVQRGWSAEGLTERAGGVDVRLRGPQGERSLHARYVVGADGMHSRVREAAGIAYTGSSFAESFVLADVAMRWALPPDEVRLFFAPAGLVVVAPLPGGSYRIVATQRHAEHAPDRATIQALLDERGPREGAARVDEVLWSSRFRLHHRIAERYRRGPYLLVGDAAHVHSPAGGQGMNTGLVDACVLANMLAEVTRGRQGDAYLDGYGALRRPAAEAVLQLSGRLTRLATLRGALPRRVRNAFLRLVDRLPIARRRMELGFSGLARASAAQVPQERPARAGRSLLPAG